MEEKPKRFNYEPLHAGARGRAFLFHVEILRTLAVVTAGCLASSGVLAASRPAGKRVFACGIICEALRIHETLIFRNGETADPDLGDIVLKRVVAKLRFNSWVLVINARPGSQELSDAWSLSVRRAEFVRDKLLALGLDAERLSIQPLTERSAYEAGVVQFGLLTVEGDPLPQPICSPFDAFERGEEPLKVGKLQEAEESFNTCLQRYPDYCRCRVGLARVDEKRGHRSAAIDQLSKALVCMSQTSSKSHAWLEVPFAWDDDRVSGLLRPFLEVLRSSDRRGLERVLRREPSFEQRFVCGPEAQSRGYTQSNRDQLIDIYSQDGIWGAELHVVDAWTVGIERFEAGQGLALDACVRRVPEEQLHALVDVAGVSRGRPISRRLRALLRRTGAGSWHLVMAISNSSHCPQFFIGGRDVSLSTETCGRLPVMPR